MAARVRILLGFAVPTMVSIGAVLGCGLPALAGTAPTSTATTAVPTTSPPTTTPTTTTSAPTATEPPPSTERSCPYSPAPSLALEPDVVELGSSDVVHAIGTGFPLVDVLIFMTVVPGVDVDGSFSNPHIWPMGVGAARPSADGSFDLAFTLPWWIESPGGYVVFAYYGDDTARCPHLELDLTVEPPAAPVEPAAAVAVTPIYTG